MHMIAYTSQFDSAAGDVNEVMNHIVETAKRENAKRHITGVLFYLQGVFLQIIEGEEAELRQLMQNVQGDERHRDIHYLIDTKVKTRGFQKWNMDSFNLETPQKFSPETFRTLTDNFVKNLIPRSDSLVFYYKTLLKHQAA